MRQSKRELREQIKRLEDALYRKNESKSRTQQDFELGKSNPYELALLWLCRAWNRVPLDGVHILLELTKQLILLEQSKNTDAQRTQRYCDRNN